MSISRAKKWRNSLVTGQKRLVVTNGCFDLLHRGHIEYLNLARQYGDVLLVAVNDDHSVRILKGSERPVFKECDRLYLLASLEAIDAVVLFSGSRASGVFLTLKPDVYVKGGDYTEETLDREEYETLKQIGCTIKFLKFIKGYSTSTIITKIKTLEP